MRFVASVTPTRNHGYHSNSTILTQSYLMRKLLVLLFTAVFLAGCNSDRGESAFATGTELAQMRAARKCAVESQGVLGALVGTSSQPIPDAVLNRTRCIAVFPSVANAKATPGVASCREKLDHWGNPLFVAFRGSVGHRPGRPVDVLIFVLTGQGVQELRSGRLKLDQRTSAPGVVVGAMPAVTDAQFSHGALTYARSAGNLSGVPVTGSAAVDGVAMHAVYSHSKTAQFLVMGAEANDFADFVNSVTSFFNTITPTGIIVHHSATIPAEQKVPANEQEIDKFHAARGFDITCSGRVYHIAYHYLILPDGRIQQGRPDRCEGAHATGYNSYLGISVLGDFSSLDNAGGKKGLTRPTPQQIRSLVVLCTRLMREYHIPLQRVLRHCDVSSTSCPGDRFPFAEVLRRLPRAPG
jgi:N-acetylmuramoyl-L-alanine amidase